MERDSKHRVGFVGPVGSVVCGFGCAVVSNGGSSFGCGQVSTAVHARSMRGRARAVFIEAEPADAVAQSESKSTQEDSDAIPKPVSLDSQSKKESEDSTEKESEPVPSLLAKPVLRPPPQRPPPPSPVQQKAPPQKPKAPAPVEAEPEVDPDLMLATQCSRCEAVYEIKSSILGRNGCKVRCAVCKRVWFQQSRFLKPLEIPEGKELVDYPEDMIEKARADASRNRRDGPGSDRRRPSQGGDRRGRPKFTAFVGNLSFDVSEETLREFCESKAEVESLRIAKEEGGRSRGFGFVDFKTRDGLETALQELSEAELSGRKVNIRESTRPS
uniref:RRM domain-containing protein n=1 Tax=Timspurckia oligopyrenoides TaxID=708627 RepID=A0A7S1EUR2_9RHOD|mmetsp:Transcript_8886/g.16009  ORF Transcript_8886/g.16009 Transcript_8886/m.16009 type:complete len:328 (+) Transcript_8886:36-1019(+)|eukprot:CAMPEP_0182444486 /NCGR_PEP_ID=MMETSP1172-20130603/2925_1 /TAXON_ID=708627 /ORGANISM="Timspurckia oligopyrenoides, Strain CCMP3278" /LENGTH=327 /DNA_ID=CAMNT_0024640051 /DNA_START=21 /DNA_END=1004 /DNA_ORIENTATION=+